MSNRETTCRFFPENIDSAECVSSSLGKLNRNFQRLEDIVYALEDRLTVNQVRTFFYYGPNSQSDPRSGMNDNSATRPSNGTIQAYVNSNTQLSLPTVSKTGDIAYVIYQKTGYYSTANTNFEGIPQQTTSDIINYQLPVFITWRLTFNGTAYLVDTGFPKFSAAFTSDTPAQPGNTVWNQPQRWATF